MQLGSVTGPVYQDAYSGLLKLVGSIRQAQDALHDFLDTTFGSMISAHDTPGGEASSSSDSEEEEHVAVGLEAEKGDAPGFQLFGRLPKRKAPTASGKISWVLFLYTTSVTF